MLLVITLLEFFSQYNLRVAIYRHSIKLFTILFILASCNKHVSALSLSDNEWLNLCAHDLFIVQDVELWSLPTVILHVIKKQIYSCSHRYDYDKAPYASLSRTSIFTRRHYIWSYRICFISSMSPIHWALYGRHTRSQNPTTIRCKRHVRLSPCKLDSHVSCWVLRPNASVSVWTSVSSQWFIVFRNSFGFHHKPQTFWSSLLKK